MTDHYSNLGVGKDASADDIKRAFRKKASENHPDKAGGDKAQFQVVAAAYAVLGDAERRKRYDDTGQSDDPPSLEQRAETLLRMVFNELLQQDGDCVAGVRAHMKNLGANIKSDRAEFGARSRRLEKKRTRIKVKGAARNLAHEIIDQALGELKDKMRQADEMLNVHRVAMDLLAAYEDEPEPVEKAAVQPQKAYRWTAADDLLKQWVNRTC